MDDTTRIRRHLGGAPTMLDRDSSPSRTPPIPIALATMAIWVISTVSWSVAAVVQQLPSYLEISFRGGLIDLIGFLLCGTNYFLLEATLKAPTRLRVVGSAFIAIVETYIYMSLLYLAYYYAFPLAKAPSNWALRNTPIFVAILWTFLAWFAVYFSIRLGLVVRDTKAMAVETQNQMLRYQLDPHFLFNIHNGLATLIHEGRMVEAEQMVLSLSAFLRKSLQKEPSTIVTIQSELATMRHYMSLEALRYGDLVVFSEVIAPDTEHAMVPGFVLQPLIENAVKHGLGDRATPLTVEIGAARKGENLTLWVRDDGAGGMVSGRSKLGVGLENIRQRLLVLYGAKARLVTETCKPQGFCALLIIPWSRSPQTRADLPRREAACAP